MNGTAPTPESGARLRIGGQTKLAALRPETAEAWLGDLARAASEQGLERLAAFCRDPTASDRSRLGAVLELSPYLNGLMLRRPDWLERLFDVGAAERVREIVGDLRGLRGRDMTEAEMMTRLREAKAEASLLIALRDLFGAADGAETTAALSELAESSIGAALRFLLVDLDRRGKLRLPDRDRPEEGCGLFVLGMGKLGAGELNYSSDVDLIVFFEPDVPAIVDPDESVETFSRLVKRLIRILSERTGDGYVFRTDLRLRPDPSAMPLAIPVPTALGYYEVSGRNWERAAMLKSRPLGGDAAAAAAFLRDIAPFVWRKYLDFNAVSEIQSMKQRIDKHRGFGGLSVAGHNVKLGPGGIREIEFFAQAQQLIAGGRAPELRVRRTDEALRLLADGGWIASETAEELTRAYWFLRRTEHAIQMVADEQSHTLPEDDAGLARIAALLGFPGAQEFGAALLAQLSLGEAHFDALFSGDTAGEVEGERLFQLVEKADIDGLGVELASFGFARPDAGARILAGWNTGRYRAMRSAAARQHLAAVLPELLRSLGAAVDPDGSLVAFDAFLSGLPAGLQFFALLASNPKVLDLLMLIITSAPRLSATISERAHVFDAFLDPTFFRELPDRALLASRLRSFMADVGGLEDELVRLRLFASEQRFLVGARLLSATIEGERAGEAYSDIADVVIGRAFHAVLRSFAERHGQVPGGRIALFGMGRLGSRELTAGSDVDLIIFYDHPEEEDESDGEKPLPASVYHARLTQRLIAALSSPMGEGILYEVDFRLRPSGNKGPLATHLDAFRRYQETEARTWERMALTRSRFLAGDRDFGTQIEAAIAEILAKSVGDPALDGDIAAMRSLIEREKPPRGPLDLKLRPGGIIDLEFLAQWALLAGKVPRDLIGRPTTEVLAALDGSDGTMWSDALRQTRALHVLRLGPEKAYDLEALPVRLAERLALAVGAVGIADILPAIEETALRVRSAFAERVVAG